jgi:hypothetical protein
MNGSTSSTNSSLRIANKRDLKFNHRRQRRRRITTNGESARASRHLSHRLSATTAAAAHHRLQHRTNIIYQIATTKTKQKQNETKRNETEQTEPEQTDIELLGSAGGRIGAAARRDERL